MVHLAENHRIPKPPISIHLLSNFHRLHAHTSVEPQTVISSPSEAVLELRRSKACKATDTAFQDRGLLLWPEFLEMHHRDRQLTIDCMRYASPAVRIEQKYDHKADAEDL